MAGGLDAGLSSLDLFIVNFEPSVAIKIYSREEARKYAKNKFWHVSKVEIAKARPVQGEGFSKIDVVKSRVFRKIATQIYGCCAFFKKTYC